MQPYKIRKILIVTQAVDRHDPVLGFFTDWIAEFAKHADTVLVFALRVGEASLPENVSVISLRPRGRSGRIAVTLRECWKSWRYRHEYDAVFVHMNMEHILAIGWLWRLLGKRIALWYAHGTVSLRLRSALPFVSTVFTPSNQSLRLGTKKKHVMGQGLSVDSLPLLPPPTDESQIRLLTVGRVAPVKRVDALIVAVSLLAKKGRSVVLNVAGNGEPSYIAELKVLAKREGVDRQIVFLGPVIHENLPDLYRNTHLFLHTSETGSLDKAPLEALACGVPVISVNPEILEEGVPFGILVSKSAESMAAAIDTAVTNRLWRDEEVRAQARAYTKKKHDLKGLIPSILADMQE